MEPSWEVVQVLHQLSEFTLKSPNIGIMNEFSS